MLPTLLPVATLLFGMGYVQLGILVAVGYLATAIVQPVAGRYSDIIEPRILLALGIGIMGVSALIIGYATDYPLLLLGAVLLRTGSSFYHPIANSVVSRTTKDRPSVDRRMGIQSAFGDLGALFVFLFAAMLYSLLSWKGPFLIFALVDIGFALVVFVLLGSINSLEFDHGTTHVPINQPSEKIYTEDGREVRSSIPNLPPVEINPTGRMPTIFLFAATFISAGSYAVTLNFANSLLSRESGSIVTANLLVSFWLAAFVLGDFLSGELARKIDRELLILLGYALSAILAIVFASVYHDLSLAAVALAGNGFTLSITFPLSYSELGSRSYYSSGSLPSGTLFGVLFTSQVAGSAALTYLAGELSVVFGASSPFAVAGCLLLGLSIFGISVMGHSRKRMR